jgi:hypothetical protein
MRGRRVEHAVLGAERQHQGLCAVMRGTRWSSAPEVPTVDEAGLPGFHVGSWNSLWVRHVFSVDLLCRDITRDKVRSCINRIG